MKERHESENFTNANKPIMELSDVDVLDLEDKLYLVAGRSQIFLLGEENDVEWARKLTAPEIESLPVDIFWSGGDTNFEADNKRTTELSKCFSDLVINISD